MVQLRHVLSQIFTLSGDQNEVFESLVNFQRLISWNPAVNFFFFFNIWLLWFDYSVYQIFSTLEKAEIPQQKRYKSNTFLLNRAGFSLFETTSSLNI